MQVYRPSLNSVSTLKLNNPAYFALCVSRSEYSQNEIEQELENIEIANDALCAFLSSAYDLLEDMDYIKGFDSEAHMKLNQMLSGIDYIGASFSDNSHTNCFPVRKWQSSIASLYRQIAKIEKFIQQNF